jgi:hypothetical protein
MKSKYGRKHLWLDVVEMIRQLRPADQVVVVRYFSAIVKNEPAAAQNQYDYIAAMKAHNGSLLDVQLGRFKSRTIRHCRRCGQAYTCSCGREYRSFEEKGTDVALGAMMVADAARGIADTSVLISADTDLAPALAAFGWSLRLSRYTWRCRPAALCRHATSRRSATSATSSSERRCCATPAAHHGDRSRGGANVTRPVKWS